MMNISEPQRQFNIQQYLFDWALNKAAEALYESF